jgi:hypothetical protein
MWHNKAPNEQKINFIFFDFLLGERIFMIGGEGRNGKIIAISSWESISGISRQGLTSTAR